MSEITILLIIEAMLTVYYMIEDLRTCSFYLHTLFIGYIPSLLILLKLQDRYLTILAIVFIIEFVIFYALGKIGLMDVLIPIKVPVLIYIATKEPKTLLLFVITSASAILWFIKFKVCPMLADKKDLTNMLKGNPVKIKKEFIDSPYLIFTPHRIEDDELQQKIKEAQRRSPGDVIEAYVGVPYLFVFFTGYITAIISYILLS